MRDGWQKVRLGDVAEILLGKMLDQKKNKGAYHKFLNNVSVRWGGFDLSGLGEMKFEEDEYDRYLVRKGDIVMCEGGECGRCAMWKYEDPIFYQKALHRIRAGKSVDQVFLYYQLFDYFRSGKAKGVLTGTTIQHLPRQVLLDLEISLPTLATQKKIAAVLGVLDDKIELNRKMNANLEAQAQALFKSWFVDFEPFGGKMPKAWKKGRLDEIAEYNCGRISANELTILNFITTENMTADKGGVSAATSLPIIDQVPLFDRGDVLISNIRPYFKKIWRADCRGGRSADVLCLKAKAPILQFYLYRLLWDDAFFAYVMQSAKGTKMPRGDKRHILEYGCVVPTTEVLAKFNKMLCPICELIEKNVAESRKLAELRDTLLPKLMKGEIEV